MDRSYIGRLESGHAPFGSDMEERFSRFFGADIEEFYRPLLQSEYDKDLAMLKDEMTKYGGVEKIKRLRKLLPALFDESSDSNNKIAGSNKSKRTA